MTRIGENELHANRAQVFASTGHTPRVRKNCPTLRVGRSFVPLLFLPLLFLSSAPLAHFLHYD